MSTTKKPIKAPATKSAKIQPVKRSIQKTNFKKVPSGNKKQRSTAAIKADRRWISVNDPKEIQHVRQIFSQYLPSSDIFVHPKGSIIMSLIEIHGNKREKIYKLLEAIGYKRSSKN